MKKKFLLSGLFILMFSGALIAQVNVRDSTVQGFIFNFNLGFNATGGDMSHRYGTNPVVGLDIGYKTKSNWLIGAGGDYLFGTNLNNVEEIIQNMLTEDGNIIGTGGDYTQVKFLMRGFTVQGKVGKILPLIGPNRNSGILTQVGLGYIQHKVQIDHLNSVFQLNEPYIKGYDQLHNGIVLSEYIAFYHSGNRRKINFTAGFHFMQGFTQSARGYNYYSKSYDTEKKTDLFYGIKLSWFLPIYDKNAQSYFYN